MTTFDATIKNDNFTATFDTSLDVTANIDDAISLSAEFSGERLFSASIEDGDSLTANLGEIQKVSTSNYEELYNLPKIEGNTVIGDKTFIELGLNEITPQEIDEIIFGG